MGVDTIVFAAVALLLAASIWLVAKGCIHPEWNRSWMHTLADVLAVLPGVAWLINVCRGIRLNEAVLLIVVGAVFFYSFSVAGHLVHALFQKNKMRWALAFVLYVFFSYAGMWILWIITINSWYRTA